MKDIKEMLWRIEFKEDTQQWHHQLHGNITHPPNTHGWVTAIDRCTNGEAYLFEAFATWWAANIENVFCDNKIRAEHLPRIYNDFQRKLNDIVEHKTKSK